MKTDVTQIIPGRTYRIAMRRGSGTVKVLRLVNYEVGLMYDAEVLDGLFAFRLRTTMGVSRMRGDFVCFRASEVSKIMPAEAI